MRHAPEHAPEPATDGGGTGKISLVFLLVALLLLIAAVKSSCSEKEERRAQAKAEEAAQTAAAHAAVQQQIVLPDPFPKSGEGHATKEGLRTYLDPRRSYTRPSGPAKYCFAEDLSLCFDDTEGAKVDRTPHRKMWQDMPEGKYIVYPLGVDDIFFRWWQ